MAENDSEKPWISMPLTDDEGEVLGLLALALREKVALILRKDPETIKVEIPEGKITHLKVVGDGDSS